MPTKKNNAGKMQNYVPAGNPAGGQYGDNETGSNKNFKSFKKPREYKEYWEQTYSDPVNNITSKNRITRIRYEQLKEEGKTNILSEKPYKYKDFYWDDEKELQLTDKQQKIVDDTLNNLKIDGNRNLAVAYTSFSNMIGHNLNYSMRETEKAEAIANAYFDELVDKWTEARKISIENGKKELNKLNKISGDHNLETDLIETNYENYEKTKNASKEEYFKYHNNCQRCVQAYLLRRKGYDVEATERLKNDSELLKKGWETAIFLPPKYGLKTYDNEQLGKSTKTQLQNIEKIVGNDKEGSIYLCSVDWRGFNGAHVFIVEKNNGKVRFIDPQNFEADTRYRFEKDEWSGQYRINPKYTKLVKVDDLDINNNIPLVVRNKKR